MAIIEDASKAITRSSILEGKTELSDEDIIKLLDLPADRLVQSKIAAYTDKSYEEIKENYEELLKLSDRLKKEPEYLKYRNTFIAKTKLLYQESAVLYNEIPALIILDKINEPAYLLPYQYAKKGNEEKSFADSLKDKNNAFTDFKRVFSGDFSRDYKKGKKQGNQVFISNNLPITKNEAFSELIRIIRGIKSNDKTNSVYLYSENDSKLYLFNINKTGFVELQDEFNLKQIRLTPLGKPSVTEDISNSIDTPSINKTIYTTNNFVNDYFTESLLDRGCIQELKRNKQIKNRFSRYMNTLNHLQSLSNDLPEGLVKDSNNYFIKTEKDSQFYKDIIEDKNRNTALNTTKTKGEERTMEKEKIEVQTYKFQNGETIDEILSKQTSWTTDEECLDNMIDNSLREVADFADEKENPTIINNNEKSQKSHSNAKEYMIQTTRLFLSKLKEKSLPFLQGKEQGSKIIIKPQAVREALTGKAFTGYTQLMAQALIQAVYEQKKIPELEYELITYDQAKTCGTFIKKGSPHITLTNYNTRTNAASKQMYYFKSGCKSPEIIDLTRDSITRNRIIKKIRLSLSDKELTSEQQAEEKNKITLLHYKELTYLKTLKKDAEQYINSLPAEEKNMLTELCTKKPLEQKTVQELAQTLRKNKLLSTQLSSQKNSERSFDATECIVPEDFIAKAMAAASLGCSLETTEKTIEIITKNLHQTLSNNIEHYDYGKAFDVGEVINEKCIKNCKEMKNQEYEAAELVKKLEQKQQELKKNPIGILTELLNKTELSNRTIGGYER